MPTPHTLDASARSAAHGGGWTRQHGHGSRFGILKAPTLSVVWDAAGTHAAGDAGRRAAGDVGCCSRQRCGMLQLGMQDAADGDAGCCRQQWRDAAGSGGEMLPGFPGPTGH